METKTTTQADAPGASPRVIGKEIMTLLEAADEGKTAAKRFRKPQNEPVRSAQKCTYWKPHQRAVTDLWGAYEVLREAAENPRLCYVRGALKDPKASAPMRRKHRGADATLIMRPRHLHCIDLDGVEISRLDMDNPEAGLRAWVGSLRALRGVDAFINLSASWLIKSGVHLHLWVWTDRALSDLEAKTLFTAMLPFAIDPRIYSPSQPHYFADPIFDFKSGAGPNYFGERWFFITATDSDTDGELHVDTGSAATELAYWEGRIKDLGDNPRHAVINSAGYFLGRYVKAGTWGFDALVDKLLEAAAESGAFDDERLTAAADEIRRAISDGMSDTADDMGDWKAGLMRSEEGKLKTVPYNLLLQFRNHPALKGLLRYNVRYLAPEWTAAPPWDGHGGYYPRRPRDADAFEAAAWFNMQGFTFSEKAVYGAIGAVAWDVTYDAVREWLERLPQWDGVERIAAMLSTAARVPEGPWPRRLGELIIDSMVWRAMRPGCKVDAMPVLASHVEGVGKSTFFKILATGPGDEYFSDSVGDYSSEQKLGESIGHHWVMEDSELSSLRKRDIEHVMRALSSQSDKFRPAYGHYLVERPRMCMFCGTTNDEQYADPSRQNRRFPGVKVGEIDTTWLLEHREQVFAEGMSRFANRSRPYISRDEKELQTEALKDLTIEDPWEALIVRWLDAEDPGADEFGPSLRDNIQAADVLREALGVSTATLNIGQARRVGGILRRLGWVKVDIRADGKVTKRFKRPTKEGKS